MRQMAIELARERESKLTFLSVVDAKSLLARSTKLEESARGELRWVVDVLLRIAVQHAAREQVEATQELREGPVADTIMDFVHEMDADLLILGAPRGTTANVFGDDAIENFARNIQEKTGIDVRIARPEMV